MGNEAQTRLRGRTCLRCHGGGTATQKQREKWWGLGPRSWSFICVCGMRDSESILVVSDLTALRTTSLSYELQTKGKVIHIHLISFVRSKAPPLSSSFDPKWSGKRFSQKKSRKFLSNFIQVLIPVSLIWTISTLRYVIWGPGFRSWSVTILSVRHLQLYIFPEVKLVIWWFPTLGVTPQASMDDHFSIETTMVTTGDPPWLKKHHRCSDGVQSMSCIEIGRAWWPENDFFNVIVWPTKKSCKKK